MDFFNNSENLQSNIHRHAFAQEQFLCTIPVDSLIGANDDMIGEILNYEKENIGRFVDNFQSKNEKMASKIKNVMKEVIFDHFQLTEGMLRSYWQKTKCDTIKA